MKCENNAVFSCLWLKICLYLAKWLLCDNVKFKTCKETLVILFFSLSPCQFSLSVFSAPCPCSVFQPGLDPPFPGTPHSHWTLFPAGPASLCRTCLLPCWEKTDPAPSSCSHCSLGPSRRPLQVWWHGRYNSKGQSRPRQGLVIELIWVFELLTSDQTQKCQTLRYGHSHLPSPRNQTPLNKGAISAPTLSPSPLDTQQQAPGTGIWWGWFCSVLLLLCKNA